RLLDRHRALLSADELYRLRATAPAAGCGRVHPARFSRLFPCRTLMGQTPWRCADTCTGTGVAQRVGLRRLRYHPRLGAHRPFLNRRGSGGVGLGGGYQRALGALVLLLAPKFKVGESCMKKPVPPESASALIDKKIEELGDWRG